MQRGDGLQAPWRNHWLVLGNEEERRQKRKERKRKQGKRTHSRKQPETRMVSVQGGTQSLEQTDRIAKTTNNIKLIVQNENRRMHHSADRKVTIGISVEDNAQI